MPSATTGCSQPRTQINRAVTRFWWAAALLEVGQSLDRGRAGPRHRALARRHRPADARGLASNAAGQPSARGVLLGLGDEADVQAPAARAAVTDRS